MKHLPDWVTFLQQTALFRAPFSFCLAPLGRSQGQLGTVLLLLLTAFLPLYAQPTVQWDRTIGGSGYDNLVRVQQTQEGGYILGGTSFSESGGDKTNPEFGIWVVKLDAAGNKVWDRTIERNAFGQLADLQQTSDGGYILGGPPPGAADDYWIVKLDAAGNRQWDKTIGGPGYDDFSSLQQTRDGGFILGGSSSSNIGGDKTESSKGGFNDYWVVKLDAAGNKVWDRTIGGNDGDQLENLQQTSDGGYILGGVSYSGISGDKTEANRGGLDYWVVKLDAAGNKVWDKTLGGSSGDGFMPTAHQIIQQTREGGYILGGISFSGISGDKTEASKGGTDYWVVKLDAAGNKQWDKTIGGSSTDRLEAIQPTLDGGYILGGWSSSPISGDKTEGDELGDFWVVKLDAAGNKEWDMTIGGSSSDQLISLQQTRDGGFILGGDSNSNISGDKTEDNKGICWGDICTTDFWVVKLAPFPPGEQEQVKSFTLINTESEQPIRLLHDGDTLSLTDLPRKLNIRADTSPDTVGSVVFALIGPQTRLYVDNEVPYALFGDIKGDYEKWYPAPGSYSLTAIPFSQPDGQGTEGTPLTIHFTVKSPQVVGFTLINTSSEQPIRPLRDGDTLNLAELPKKLNIRADTNPATVGSVQFALSGQQTRTYRDNAAPYALFGDVRGDYNKWYPAPGSYTLTATSYTGRGTEGAAGTPLTIQFTVVSKPAAPLAARIKQAPAAARAVPAANLTLYPNPTADGRLQVQLAGEEPGPIRYTLLSAVGRKLAEGAVTPIGNLLTFDFSRQLRSTGLYYLRLEGAAGQQTGKILRR